MYVRFWYTNPTISFQYLSELSDDSFTPLLILCLIVKTWKQARYLSADEWIQRMGVYTKRILCSGYKEVILPFIMSRIELEDLVKWRQLGIESQILNDLTFVLNLNKVNLLGTK